MTIFLGSDSDPTCGETSFSFRPAVKRRSNVMKIFGPTVRNKHMALQFGINVLSS